MIPIIIVWGHKISLYKLGWTARPCLRCRKVQAFECFDQAKQSHVYYIYGKEKSIGRVLVCDFCETGAGFSMGSKEEKVLVVDSHWNRTKPLQELVNSTNPRLGQVPVSEKPTRDELFALLESVNERSSPFKIDAGGGFGLGAVIGAPVMAVLGLLLSLIGFSVFDALGSLMAGFFAGIFVGGTIGAVKFKFNRAKELAQEILVASMDQKSLTLETLQRALRHYPRRLKYAAAGLAQLSNL